MYLAKLTGTFIVLITIVLPSVYAQDLIIFNDGEEIEAKVIEITPNEVKYQKWPPSEDRPKYTEVKSKIFMIKYKGGAKDVFKEKDNEQAEVKSLPPLKISAMEASIAGEKDAMEFHRGGGNFFLGLGFGIFGIIGVAATRNPRAPDLVTIPEPRLVTNAYYLASYKKRAHKSNMNMVAAGTFVATALILASVNR